MVLGGYQGVPKNESNQLFQLECVWNLFEGKNSQPVESGKNEIHREGGGGWIPPRPGPYRVQRTLKNYRNNRIYKSAAKKKIVHC